MTRTTSNTKLWVAGGAHQSKPRSVPHQAVESIKPQPRSSLKHAGKGASDSRAKVSGAKIMKLPLRDFKSDNQRHKTLGSEYKVATYNEFEEELDTNRKALVVLSNEFLHNTHELSTTELKDVKSKEEKYTVAQANDISTIFAPLSLSQISTQVSTKSGATKRTTSTPVGERVMEYKLHIETCDTELHDAWTDYYDNMARMIALGRDILGHDMVVGLNDTIKSMVDELVGQAAGVSFNKQLALWEVEHNIRVGELRDEVDALVPKATKRISKMDKELRDLEKVEKERLLMSLQT